MQRRSRSVDDKRAYLEVETGAVQEVAEAEELHKHVRSQSLQARDAHVRKGPSESYRAREFLKISLPSSGLCPGIASCSPLGAVPS